ncbi:MAG: DUF4433 domain-containing protein [Planctomycetaceae bacterium]|nr:DUF4433 domain-containing protein [Planctomycetaceae bacterium]
MTDVHHITHIDNLSGILEAGGLLAESRIQVAQLQYKNIGHSHIKQKRIDWFIPGWNAMTLGQCVPFYFANRPPMLYSIARGKIAGYSEGQIPVIYLVTSAEIINDSGLRYCFTDGHAVDFITTYFHCLEDLPRIDWKIVNMQYWNNAKVDADRKRRKQAEFLIYDFVPWQYIEKIAVIDSVIRDNVACVFDKYPKELHRPISVEPSWYY